MTTINIDGPISQIVTSPIDPDLSVVSLECGTRNFADPTVINRLAKVTVVIGTFTGSVGPNGSSPVGFKIGSGFVIGDIIELYMNQPSETPVQTHGVPGILEDEFGLEMSLNFGPSYPYGQMVGRGFRKVFNTETGQNWAMMSY